ncbi:monovalent cation/H+ antiporter complex subunit F [Brevibacterium jeotgali]|uniref:Multisubunit Na+/H+ antiporter, MnhF subunit n=1 Tax=Brevibacterium jeotgali TaxID=1262550 RepID=A0A2H1L5E2_9MICO|nr:monovalent cation/H+ antiporter complex subunit F [Brevibacterium jeotgali]TWB98460.1 multisubunit Na+/H+ antiporter MnhF subunit [Brevibacterium jeotgali]SMY12089.1 Multisubunit Na+/H+ antiporter, MnhF subunit [Brevibacterium jeotgali]
MNGQQGIPLVSVDDGMGLIAAIVIGAVFLAAVVVAIVRIVRGPSILDRMIATDTLLATIMCALGGLAAFSARTDLFPVVLVIAMFGFVGAVGVSRYVSRADLRTTSRFRRMGRGQGSGSIGTADGHEPTVPELAIELEAARRADPERDTGMETAGTDLDASSTRVTDGPDDWSQSHEAPHGGDHDSEPTAEAVADPHAQSSGAEHREDETSGGGQP